MKVGRNDPCPCGSGKKYKKCCLNKPKSDSENTVQLKTSELRSQLEQLTTSQILKNIQAAGVDINAKKFVEELNTLSSAKELLSRWEKQLKVGKGQLPPAYYISILILAKRLLPDKILLEDIRDLMQDGYNLGNPYPDENGLFIWWKLWKDVQVWAKEQQIHSVEELDQATKDMLPKSFSEWVNDFDAALEKAAKSDKRFIPMRHVFADDLLNCFPHSKQGVKEQIIIAREEAASY